MTEIVTKPLQNEAGVRRVDHWIDGSPYAGASGRNDAIYDPSTGRQCATVNFAEPSDVDRAAQSARESFLSWRATSLARRTELFFRIRQLVYDRADEVSQLVSLEHGKVLAEARAEVMRGIEVIDYCCNIATLLKGGFSEQASTGIDVYSIRQPLGVVAGITPFNAPIMVPIWMWAPAIACGNAFILKPSERDPSASLWTAELLQEAGLPDGVFNVVNGDRVAVEALVDHPGINAVSFIGSTAVARNVYARATAAGKRCQALAGAKNHMIVLPDADIDAAADAAVSGAYGWAGERCMAVSELVAVGNVADPLIEAIKERIATINVGPGSDPDSDIGALISEAHRERVAGYIESAADEGATVLVDGRAGVPDEGFFLRPSLVDHVRPGMRIYDDEVFGPVLGITRVETFDDALELVNANPWGNGVALFTRDGGAARRFQFDVQVGMVGINVPVPVPVSYYSFGGWKNSPFGDRHMHGSDAVEFYSRSKVVTSRWPDPGTSAVDLGFPTNTSSPGG